MVGRGELTDGEWAICFCLPLVGYLGARVPGNQGFCYSAFTENGLESPALFKPEMKSPRPQAQFPLLLLLFGGMYQHGIRT